MILLPKPSMYIVSREAAVEKDGCAWVYFMECIIELRSTKTEDAKLYLGKEVLFTKGVELVLLSM